MPSYRTQGDLPAKRHTRLPQDSATSFNREALAYEHVITTAGFDRAYAIMYHRRPPTRIRETQLLAETPLESVNNQPLRHHHIRSGQIPRQGDPITGRIPFMFNQDMVALRSRPAVPQAELFRNAAADEVIFIQQGSGTLESAFGRLPYRQFDYIVIPRTTIYRLVPDDINAEDHLILESFSPVRIPQRYQNPDGQIVLGAPYYERDFHSPAEPLHIDDNTDTPILTKDHARLCRMILAHHPFDAVGWDGHVYPYTFNALDFEPLTGTVHLPPPFQQTFECRGFVICTFAPRHLDHHPEAIKVPYVHSNVEADEVLFYAQGRFGSRRGVEQASFSLHPSGIPHGPHPGTILASMRATRTEELAVMFDTERRLHLTQQAMALDDADYPQSWMEPSGDGGD